MRNFKLLVLALALPVVLAPLSGHAQLDSETEKVLIQKFTQVYLKLAPSDPSKNSVTLRLADLHAEHARKLSMDDMDKGRADRVKALQYYREALPKIEESKQGRIWIQMGHLEELNGNDAVAIQTYEKALKMNQQEEYKAEAALSLGEMYFKKRNYSQARKYLMDAMNSPKSGNPGLAAYRLAWCDFNESKIQASIDQLVQILKTPELLTRGPRTGNVLIDKQFQEEVSRDLATFLVKRQLRTGDAELVYELSPDTTKIANVVHLAGEAERLGQLPAAITAFRYAIEKQADPVARLESHVHLAQLQAQIGQRASAVKDFEMALSVWQENPCAGEACAELKTRLKNFVVDWNKLEKKTPSPELFASYQAYNRVFANEAAMIYYSAVIAQELKKYPEAFALYEKSAGLGGDTMEASLLGAIEVGELAKDNSMMIKSYDLYLTHSKDKKKTLEVQYQKAHLMYEMQPTFETAVALKAVAMSPEKGDAKIKKQAADLAMDNLVLAKKTDLIGTWAGEFALAFPQSSEDFQVVARKNTLNQVADLSKNTEGMNSAWAVLAQFDVKSASPAEKITYYKNKLILAEKLQKFREARDAAEMLLAQNGLNKEDQIYALSRKAWLAEMILDFDQALVATQKLPEGATEPEAKLLKMALYSDLAAKDPSDYYQKFLTVSKDEEKKLAIAAQLVKMAKDPAKEIEKNKVILGKKPELLAELYLEAYAKHPQASIIKSVTGNQALEKTPAGQYMKRLVFLEGFQNLKGQVEKHQIDSSKQSKLAATLKARVALLNKVDDMARTAIQTNDWMSQVMALDLVATQNKRFYEEVLALPVPAGLEAEQEQEYLSALSQQAAPHMTKAQDSALKVSEMWKSDVVSQYQASLKTQKNANMTKLITQEIQTLMTVAPEAQKSSLMALAAAPPTTVAAAAKPDLKQMELARASVRENPMSKESLLNLIQMEKQAGRESMVSYLETRLQTLPATVERKEK